MQAPGSILVVDDRESNRHLMKEILENEPNLRIKQAEVASLLMEKGRAAGVLLRDGRQVRCGAVIITTGTFLNGLAHVGEQKYSCGRNGEAPSQLLGDQLRSSGLAWTRLKTGTPPRLDARSADWLRARVPKAGWVTWPRGPCRCHARHPERGLHRAKEDDPIRVFAQQ